MNSAPIPDTWREEYLHRPTSRLPGDLLKACDEIRSQRREINTLRGQVLRSRIKNVVLAGVLGGAAAKGIEVGVVALIALFSK
jgi:hypothetical protein